MGHERLGFLPKTYRWQRVLSSLESFAEHQIDIGTISNRVLQNVKSRFESIPQDEGVCAGFTYLLAVGSLAHGLSVPKKLLNAGLNPSLSWSPLELTNGINNWVDKNKGSQEYAELAKRAAADSLILWFRARNTGQASLFKSMSRNQEIWRISGEGGDSVIFQEYTSQSLWSATSATSWKERLLREFPISLTVNACVLSWKSF